MRFMLWALPFLLQATQVRTWPRELVRTQWAGVSSHDDVMVVAFGPAGQALVTMGRRKRTISGYRLAGPPVTRRGEWYVVDDNNLCLQVLTGKGKPLGEPSCLEATLRGSTLLWGDSQFKKGDYDDSWEK